jgi:hypothetical protein
MKWGFSTASTEGAAVRACADQDSAPSLFLRPPRLCLILKPLTCASASTRASSSSAMWVICSDRRSASAALRPRCELARSSRRRSRPSCMGCPLAIASDAAAGGASARARRSPLRGLPADLRRLLGMRTRLQFSAIRSCSRRDPRLARATTLPLRVIARHPGYESENLINARDKPERGGRCELIHGIIALPPPEAACFRRWRALPSAPCWEPGACRATP